MKKLVVNKTAECMACLECVRACSTAFYKVFDPDLSCIRIVAKGTGAKRLERRFLTQNAVLWPRCLP